MPVRKRGESWQLDVRTAEGTRIRRQFTTEREALEAEAAIKPNPMQRAEGRKQRRKSSVRLKAIQGTTGKTSLTVSSGHVATCGPVILEQATLPESVQRERSLCPLHAVPCTVCSGPHFAPSVPLRERIQDFPD